jgi:uncharacterized protein
VTEAFTLIGPAGAIEGLIDSPEDAGRGRVAIVCHPHPLYGGTMTNKVTYMLARACVELGAHAVRFNFRGVGSSAGNYAEGDGETDDAVTVVDWAAQRWPQAQLWLAGFSFGGAVAIRAAVARPQVARLITVAPAVQRIAVDASALPRCPWLLIQGDRDELVDPEGIRKWIAALEHPPEVKWLAGAEHFFHGRLNDLRDAVVNWPAVATR